MRHILGLVRWALVTELRMYVGALRLLARRRDVPADSEAVGYVGAVSVLLWAITVVSLVELVALHLIIPWEPVRIAADVLGIWGVVWCVGFTACHYVYPHLATPDALLLRVQRRTPALTVPWNAVAGVRVRERSLDESAALVVDGRALSVAVAKRTNLEITLARPLDVTLPLGVGGMSGRVTHEVDEVRVYVDEPRAVAELVRRQARGGAPDASSPV